MGMCAEAYIYIGYHLGRVEDMDEEVHDLMDETGPCSTVER